MRGEESQASQERRRPGTGHTGSEERLAKVGPASAATGVGGGVSGGKRSGKLGLIKRTSGLERLKLRTCLVASEPQASRSHSQLRISPNLVPAHAESSEQL